MADINKLKPFILKWEGGFVDDPDDTGGATNKGVTIETYEQYRSDKHLPKPTVEDLKHLSDNEWTDILRTYYWNRWKADMINNQSIANILVDWVWASGMNGIKKPQALLDVKADGIVGNATLKAINKYSSQRELFDRIKKARLEFVDGLCSRNGRYEKFRKGWCNRINAFEFSEE